MTTLPPAGWYPEPNSPTGQRYWDGSQWTEHVQPPAAPPPPVVSPEPGTHGSPGTEATQGIPGAAASAQAGAPSAGGWQSAAMITAPVVQIEQQGKVVESASVYVLTGPDGTPLGRAAQVGQGRGGRLLKAMSDMDRNLPVTIAFTDPSGAPVMTLGKPGGIGPQRFVLTDASGAEIGQIHQKIRMVREAFDIVMGGLPAGALSSENWRDRRFSVLSAAGNPHARVHKLYEGYARAAFTSADRYVVERVPGSTPQQRAIALGAAIAMDIALYQG